MIGNGGIDFRPTGQLNENQVFMPITPLQFKKQLSETSNDNNEIKYPENKSRLLNLISSMDETDNPILMVGTLKKN